MKNILLTYAIGFLLITASGAIAEEALSQEDLEYKKAWIEGYMAASKYVNEEGLRNHSERVANAEGHYLRDAENAFARLGREMFQQK